MDNLGKIILLLSLAVVTPAAAYSAGSGAVEASAIDSVNSLPYEFIMVNLSKSITILSANAVAAEQIGYMKGAGIAYANLGKALYLNGKYEQSTTYYLKAIRILEVGDDPDVLAETYGEYGYQLKRSDLQRANIYMRAGMTIAESRRLDRTLSKLYDNYGVIKEMENRVDSAMFYYRKALAIKEAARDSIGIPYSLNKIAGAYLLRGNYAGTFEYLKRSDAYRMREAGDFGRIENLTLYGDAYARMNRTDSAIAKYAGSLALSKKVGINYSVRYCYERLTELFKRKGEYRKALENYALLNSYKDSVLNKEVRLNIAQLELDYEAEKKDHDIALSRLELQQKTTQVYSLAGITVMMLVLGFIAYTGQKKKRMREKLELELSSRLKHAELENRIAEDKLRISRELHDNIGSQITVIISSLDNYVFAERDKEAVGRLSRLSGYGRETLKELRNTIWALKHEDADLQDLVLKISEFTGMVSDTNPLTVSVVNTVAAPNRLSSTTMLNIFRIIQESVQNTIKYAGATAVDITFAENGRGFDLTVRDNGTGFDVHTASIGNGLGNMQFRCEESGGVFAMTSSDTGTLISCSFTVQ